MAEKKMTKKEMFAQVIAMAQGKATTVTADEIVAFANREIELLEKKSATRSKAEQAKDSANEKLMERILDVLKSGGKTVSEMMAADEVLGDLSNQKVSALANKLCDLGKVVKSTDKKKSIFRLA